MNNNGIKATGAPSLGPVYGNDGMQILFSAIDLEKQQNLQFSANAHGQDALSSSLDQCEPKVTEKNDQEKSKVNGKSKRENIDKNTPPSITFPQVLQYMNYSASNATNVGMDLRCLACGMACQSVEVLHKHIVYKHLRMESFPNAANPALLLASKDSYSDLPEVGKGVNKSQKNILEFPIPTPNFGLINSSYGAAQHLDPALKTAIPGGFYGQVSTSFPTFPSMPVSPHLKSFPVQPFSNPYGMMNSFLGMNYSSIPVDSFYPNSTLPGFLGANMNMYSPYLSYPVTAGQSFLPTTTRLPFLPADITAEKNDGTLKSFFPVVQSPKQNNETSDVQASSKNGLGDNYFLSKELDARHSGLRPSISEAYQRRMSTPILGMNNSFRYPYPYNRLGKISDINEQVDVNPVAGKNQSKNNSRDPGNRLNAKSIEQHISKLISNNEKVLLNPALERVKPRRVFRRNSLDPASLSSYATSISGRNSGDLQYGEERMHKVERKFNNVNHRRGSLVPEMLRSSELHQFSPGMTSLEYKKMIQLTRAPHGKPHVVEDANRMQDFMKRADKNLAMSDQSQLLGKRDSVTQFPTMPPKKLRKTNLFECSDCGVRYRKEENYVIHKQVYCKFKNTESNGSLKILPPFNQLPLNINAATSRYSVIQKGSQTEAYFPPSDHGSSLQSNSEKIQTFLQSEIGANLTSLLHNDLCRTKSADAALQTEHRNSNEKQLLLSIKSAENSIFTSSPSCSISSPAVTTTKTSDCIPTSKLPPNKRHMQLLRCSVETTCNQSNSKAVGMPTTSAPIRKVSAPLPQTQNRDSEKISDRKLSLQNTLKPNENLFKESSLFNQYSSPRNNYKLLLHQINLSNIQDKNLNKQTPLIIQSENSIWSWEQLRKLGKLPQVINSRDNPVQNDIYAKDIGEMSDTLGRNIFIVNQKEEISYANQSGDILPINRLCPTSISNTDKGEMHSSDAVTPSSIMQDMTKNILQYEQAAECSKNLKKPYDSPDNKAVSKDVDIVDKEKCANLLLCPHLNPVFYANAHVSYCCLANPQPSLATLATDANQISMYSEWAVAEPLLLPENMTVSDLLTSWRKMKNGFRCGISVSSKDTNKLLVTDSKSNKTFNDEATTTTNDNRIEQESQKIMLEDRTELNVPQQCGYNFMKPSYNVVYTSCVKSYSDDKGEKYLISPDSHGIEVPNKNVDTVSMSPKKTAALGPAKCDVRISLPVNSTKSSSADSDSGHLEVQKLGRIKRRKTRKERSAASPREKRRALYSQSPPSPLCQMAVHQSESCKGQTDDRLKGCALCSIKAGRSDLVPEVSSACKPCREAAKSIEKSSKLETLPLPVAKSPAKCSPKYHSVHEHTNGYLDRTRASGNTQHWMTKSMPNETTFPSAFHYPAPDQNDKASKITSSSPPAMPLTTLDCHPDPVRSPCTPLLAEVVSEVIRRAAIQSKRQGNPNSHSHPLSHSRPLVPVTSSAYKPAGDSSLKTSANIQDAFAASLGASITLSAPKRNDVIMTSLADASIDGENNDHEAVMNGFGKLGRRNLVLSSRESELFLHKANNVNSNCTKESRPGLRCTKASAPVVVGETSLKEQPCQEEYISCESDADSEKEEYDDIKKADVSARPYICVECKVAFRIGGHLAKHLRSKGHTVMMQKKTLNRLKQQQHKVSGTGISFDSESVTAAQESESAGKFAATEVAANASMNKPQVLGGTEGLARSQVRALFEGNDEYACVPHCDDVIDGTYDVINPQDPRPFKCLACDVAFRFQGHLDRHFRSNLHLIAVGHYENDVSPALQQTYEASNASHPIYNDSNVVEQGNEEELIVDGEPSPTPVIESLTKAVTNAINTAKCDHPVESHALSLLDMTSHEDGNDVTSATRVERDKNEIDQNNNSYLGSYCLNDSRIRQKANKLNPADGTIGLHTHQVPIPCQMLSGFRT